MSAFAMFDCCHSGTMADLLYRWKMDQSTGRLDMTQARRANKKKVLQSVVSLSGCSDKQAREGRARLTHRFERRLVSNS